MNTLKRKFGWTDDKVPVIGQGTWMIEGSPGSKRLAIAGLRLGLDLGLTHIDTAEMYGNGRVEEMVAEATQFTIPKTSRPERARENSGGVGWELTENEVAAIDRAFPVPDHNGPLEMI